jgi:predicted  nucleic acid-binding Zn ribbon protein
LAERRKTKKGGKRPMAASTPTEDMEAETETSDPSWTTIQAKKRPRPSESPPAPPPPAGVSSLFRNPPRDDSRKPSPRYTVVFKSSSPMTIPSMDKALLGALPDIQILNQKLCSSRKTLMYKIADPVKSLNRILTQSNLQKIQAATGNQRLTAEHYDPSAQGASPRQPDKLIVIAKNVPFDYSEEEIYEALTPESRENISSMKRIKSGPSQTPTTFLKIVTKNEDLSNKLLEEGLRAIGRVFKCESQRQRPTVPRCFNCQELGHSSQTCREKRKCPKCGADHEATECTTENSHYKCPNCEGNHAAWSALCPLIKKYLEEKKEKDQARTQQLPENQPVTRKYMKSFSEIVSTKINKVEENSEIQKNNTEILLKKMEMNQEELLKTMIELQTEILKKIDYMQESLITLHKQINQETLSEMEDRLSTKANSLELLKRINKSHLEIKQSQDSIQKQVAQITQDFTSTREISKERTRHTLNPTKKSTPSEQITQS